MYQLTLTVIRTHDNNFCAVCYCTQTDTGASNLVFNRSDSVKDIFNLKLFSPYIRSTFYDSQESAKNEGLRLIHIAEDVIERRRNMISMSLTFNI